MGYLTKGLPNSLAEFPVDVFFSYSHGAFSGQSNSELKRWSQKLAEDLREELNFTGLDVSLFLDESDRQDESVDRTESLDLQLRQQVERAGLFLMMMSPQYLRSAWCRQELDWWQGRSGGDAFAVGNRLLIARIYPTNEAAWPKGLGEIPGYFFYDRDLPEEQIRPFTYRGSTRDLDQYNEALLALSGKMSQRLKAIRQLLEQRHAQWQQQQKAEAEFGQIIYLYGRRDASAAWEQTCNRLQDRRFVVNPERPQPLAENGGMDVESRSQLASSDGLLILGTEDTRAVDSDMVVIGRRYRHLAIDQRSTPLPCAVFDTVGQALQDERRMRNAENLGISWIDGTRPDWSDQLTGWLQKAS